MSDIQHVFFTLLQKQRAKLHNSNAVAENPIAEFNSFDWLNILNRTFLDSLYKLSISARPHLSILPPVFILQFCSAGLKLRGSSLQGIGPVVQLWQLLITLQDFIHVHTHDIHHLRGQKRGGISYQDRINVCEGLWTASSETWFPALDEFSPGQRQKFLC